MPKRNFDPASHFAGDYPINDGTVEFYTRANSLVDVNSIVLNLGAGRGAWFYEDTCVTRRNLLNLKGRVAKLIGADVDPAVLTNITTDENFLIENGVLPFANETFDLIIADWVLEHIEETDSFIGEIKRVLKQNGYFVARTPLKSNYISLASRIIPSRTHISILKYLQRSRKKIDVFPAFYILNTRITINREFSDFENFSYLFTPNPAYFFNSSWMYKFLLHLNRFLPTRLVSNLHVFVKKTGNF